MLPLVLSLSALAPAQDRFPGGPGAAVTLAAKYARSLTLGPAHDAFQEERAHKLRYFEFAHIPDKLLPDFKAAFLLHINSISRRATFARPIEVGPTLWAFDIRDMDWDAAVFEKLKDVEPYFHDRVVPEKDFERIEYWPGGYVGTEFYKRGPYPIKIKAGVKYAVPGLTLPPKDMEDLVKITISEVPIVRADWFFVQTAANAGRVAGYYAFLKLKSYKDIADLAGLNVEVAQRLEREIMAIIKDSGVAINNRQIVRFGCVAGAVWRTLDSKTSQGNQNALRQLNGDFKSDAHETYFTLPNRLWGLAASNDAAKVEDETLQENVPDFIAPDHDATGNDRRIHPSISCIRCHVEGLRPIRDYARRFYSIDPKKGGALLTSPDYAKFQRLRHLYLDDLITDYEIDLHIYQRALLRLLGAGWTPQRAANAYAHVWKNYLDVPVEMEQLAREIGCSQLHLRESFLVVSKAKGANADPHLVGYARDEVVPARREHIEESFGVMALAAKNLTP